MPRVVTVDNSHRERRRIVRLLDFLKRDSLTRDQLERIGRRLQKAGRRALPPLVRRLGHERDSERLYRYTCMLDFFDAATWLDQIIALTIRRSDLAEDGRLPLLEILQDYGVDVSVPPFAPKDLSGSSLNSFIETCLKEGVQGLGRFMDRFLDADEALRCQLTRRLGGRPDYGQEAAAALRMLANFEYAEVATLAVEVLGRLRHGCALFVLQNMGQLVVEGLEEQIERSIRRLGFLGISEPLPLPPSLSPGAELITAQSAPLDCYGIRTLWMSWLLSDATPVALVIQTGEGEGLLNAVSIAFESRRQHDEYLDEINADEGMFPVELQYLVNLIKDGIYHSIEHSYYLPPDIYAGRHLLGAVDLRPEQHLPSFPIDMMDGLLEQIPSHVAESSGILDEPFFEGWIFSDPLVYDLAESAGLLAGRPSDEQEPFLKRFCDEIVEPQKLGIIRRLLHTADLMQQCNAEPSAIQRVIATSLSLVGAPLPLERHPFIRRLVLESLDIAAQSLKEGYDPRINESYNEEQ